MNAGDDVEFVQFGSRTWVRVVRVDPFSSVRFPRGRVWVDYCGVRITFDRHSGHMLRPPRLQRLCAHLVEPVDATPAADVDAAAAAA